MPPPYPHCDAPDISLLRIVLISEMIRAEAPVLVSLADLGHQSGLLASTDAPVVQPLPDMLHVLRPPSDDIAVMVVEHAMHTPQCVAQF